MCPEGWAVGTRSGAGAVPSRVCPVPQPGVCLWHRSREHRAGSLEAKEGRRVFLTSQSTSASNYCRLQRGESSGEPKLNYQKRLRASVPLLPDGDRSAFLLQSSSKEKRPLDRQSRRPRSRTHVTGGQQVLDTDPRVKRSPGRGPLATKLNRARPLC